MRRALWIVSALGVLSGAQAPEAFALPARVAALDRGARSLLRGELQDAVDESEFLIRNQVAEPFKATELQNEQRELRLYEKIPLKHSEQRLAEELRNSAADHGIRLLVLEERQPPTRIVRLPAEVRSERFYELSSDELVQTHPLRLRLQGQRSQVEAWRDAWPVELQRWVESDGSLRETAPGAFEVLAVAYSFRSIEYPRIRLASARALLPRWAQREPRRFAREEPELWSLVLRSEELLARAQPLTEARRRYHLEASRLRFLRARLRGA